MLTDLILGTAGHIDHGKSTLIHALTGTETARLPEERKRGITIELGYAFLDLPPYRLGVVDVPGHEKFVRQMLAGATGIDLALLVIAADDSVKQQTREHLEILKLLDIPAGVVAITKTDLVDTAWLDLVEEEIAELLAGSFLESAARVRVSVRSRSGLDELREALKSAACIAAESSRAERLEAPFRMAIDRCFPVEGHGTVVTGSVSSGSLAVGETLEIQPAGLLVRVRALQNHDSTVERIQRGQRAAVNLGGVRHDQVDRGFELCHPGHLIASRRMFVELHLLPELTRVLKDRDRVRFHLGTTELLAAVRFPDREVLQPGESGIAMLTFTESAVATWGQPFVIRQESPLMTLGGGRVLHPAAPAIRRFLERDSHAIRELASPDPLLRAGAALWFSDAALWNQNDLKAIAGIVDPQPVFDTLVKSGIAREIRLSASRIGVIHAARLELMKQSLIQQLGRMHDRAPLRLFHLLPNLLSSVSFLGPDEIILVALRELAAEKTVLLRGQQVSLEGRGPKLTRNERLQLDESLEQVRTAGIAGPSLGELQKSATRSRESIPQLIQIAVGSGELVQLGNDLLIHREALEQTLAGLRTAFPPPSQFTVSELKTCLEISRKHAVPLCEYLDKCGLTIRSGDVRALAVETKETGGSASDVD